MVLYWVDTIISPSLSDLYVFLMPRLIRYIHEGFLLCQMNDPGYSFTFKILNKS
jgi:hypothetical protein